MGWPGGLRDLPRAAPLRWEENAGGVSREPPPRHLSITVNIYYHGADGSARRFAEEMTASGTVDAIRAEPGNLRYEYFVPLAGGETVLLIDS